MLLPEIIIAPPLTIALIENLLIDFFFYKKNSVSYSLRVILIVENCMFD